MISASGTEAYVKNILYNEHGQRTEIDYGNNVVTKYAYDDENLRLKTIETTKGGRTIQSLTYDYDDTGNVTRRSNDGFQTKDDNRKFAEHNYEYDSLNRLVKAKGSYTRSGLIIDNMLQKYDTKYDYTPGGNISRKKQSAWGVGTEGNSITDVNLSYDNEYKYDSPKPHAVTKVGSTEYTYDLDGRMTGSYDSESKFKRTFTWDEEGRLLKTVDNKHTTDYRYDANGERICKYSDLGETIYSSGYYTETDGKKISKHIYIGSTRVASQVMSRTCETSTTMKRENTLYYHTDHLGSSGYVTDKKGEFYEHTEYTSSGESWVNEKVTGNANLPYKYCLKEMDNETGLYYYGARYYDARTSRWISTDPILEKYLPTGNKEKDENLTAGGAFNPVNLNMYHYAGNNPVVMTDPDGKATKHSGMLKSVNKTYNANVAKGQFSGDKAGAVSWMIDFFIFNVSHPNRTSNERYTRVADVTIDVISNVLESKQNGHMDVADFGIFLGMVMEEDYSTGKLMIHTQIQSESPGAEPWYYVEKSQTMGEFLQGKGKVNKTAVLYIEDIYNSYKNGVDAVDKLYERNKDRMSEDSYMKLREAAKSNTLHEKGKGK